MENRRADNYRRSLLTNFRSAVKLIANTHCCNIEAKPCAEPRPLIVEPSMLSGSTWTIFRCASTINDPANMLQVGDSNIEVIVLYIPEGDGRGGNGFIVDAFNVDLGDFSNSDFVEILTNGAFDSGKSFTANEWGTINTALSAVDTKAFPTVDSVPFKEWKKLTTSTSPSTNLQQHVSKNEKGNNLLSTRRQTTAVAAGMSSDQTATRFLSDLGNHGYVFGSAWRRAFRPCSTAEELSAPVISTRRRSN